MKITHLKRNFHLLTPVLALICMSVPSMAQTPPGAIDKEIYRGVTIDTTGWNKTFDDTDHFLREEPETAISEQDLLCSHRIRDQIFNEANYDADLRKSLETPGYLIQIDISIVNAPGYDGANKFVYYQNFGNEGNDVVYDHKHLYIRVLRSSDGNEAELGGYNRCEQVDTTSLESRSLWPTRMNATGRELRRDLQRGVK